jgi:2'-5' RNA ligase
VQYGIVHADGAIRSTLRALMLFSSPAGGGIRRALRRIAEKAQITWSVKRNPHKTTAFCGEMEDTQRSLTAGARDSIGVGDDRSIVTEELSGQCRK